jgi:hypothetical protein
MGHDSKYGKVTTEHGDIPDDEPVIVFRAQDANSIATLNFYRELCSRAGSPPRHLELACKTVAAFADWQDEHPRQVRVPHSERSREWLPE